MGDLDRPKRISGGGFSGVAGGIIFSFITGDFTADGGKYYVDIVHGYTAVVMEMSVDIGSGGILAQADSVDDSVAGARRVWLAVLPVSASFRIVGLT